MTALLLAEPPRVPNRFWSLFRVVGAVSVAIAETMSGRTA